MAEQSGAPIVRQFLAEQDASCPRCGYNLRGVASDVCPECRYHITLALAPDSRLAPASRRWLLGLAALALLAGGVRTYQNVIDLARWGMRTTLTPVAVLSNAGSLFFGLWLLTIGALGCLRLWGVREKEGGRAVAATFTHRVLVYTGAQLGWSVVFTLVLRLLLGLF